MSFPAQWQAGFASFAYIFQMFDPATRQGAHSAVLMIAPPDKKIYVARTLLYTGPDVFIVDTVNIDNDLEETTFPGGDRDSVLQVSATVRIGTASNFVPGESLKFASSQKLEPLTNNAPQNFEDFSQPTPFVIPEGTDFAIVASQPNRKLSIGLGWFEQK